MMKGRLRFRLRQFAHDLRVGLLFVPLLFTFMLSMLAVVLIELEASGTLQPFEGPFFRADPSAAQAVLGAIAGSMMAVISIVYSVLVVALSLASMQYSPRILGGYIRDRASQVTLGTFIGTFAYCLIVLHSIQSKPPVVPAWAVNGGILLALASIACLIYFIHNIASGIQASNLIHRIARETERLVVRHFVEVAAEDDALPPIPENAVRIDAHRGGYLQLLDHDGLLELVERYGVAIHVAVRPGDFVARGQPLAWVAPAGAVTGPVVDECRHAFDVGSARSMQQDVAFGIRQLVDCALRAVSPTVNDPTTAVTCIDHIGDLLVVAARGHERPRVIVRGDACLVVPHVRFAELVDLGFDQVRRYGRADLTVSMRMLRALGTIAHACREHRQLDILERHARAIREGLSPEFLPVDRAHFDERCAFLEHELATARERIEQPAGSPDLDEIGTRSTGKR